MFLKILLMKYLRSFALENKEKHYEILCKHNKKLKDVFMKTGQKNGY